MKTIAVFAIAIAFSGGPAHAQVNMQYNGQASEQYSGQSNGQVNEQVDGRAARDKSQSSDEGSKEVAPVDRPRVNDAQSMDAVQRPGLQQR